MAGRWCRVNTGASIGILRGRWCDGRGRRIREARSPWRRSGSGSRIVAPWGPALALPRIASSRARRGTCSSGGATAPARLVGPCYRRHPMPAHVDEKSDEVNGSVAGSPVRRSRRQLLKGAGALLVASAASAAGYLGYDRWQRFGRDAARTVRDHRVVLPAGAPRMVIVRGGTPAVNARAAMARLGGLHQFVTPRTWWW